MKSPYTNERPFIGKLHYCFVFVAGIALGLFLSSFTMRQDQRSAFKFLINNPFGDSDTPKIKIGGNHHNEEIFHRFENRSIADELTKKVRILCLVMTSAQNHIKKALPIKGTWGKRCSILLFMSTKEDDSLPAVALSVKEGRNFLWAKTKEAFRYVYHYYLKKADWVLKVDDETYVVLENLRRLLYSYNSSEPLYFGCRYKSMLLRQGYMTGEAGYVLSKEAVHRLIEQALPNPKKCRQTDTDQEDLEIGKCLENVDVVAKDSRDEHERGRFFPLVPEKHLIPGPKDPKVWYWKYSFYKTKQGMDCCSDNAITFHHISPRKMYLFEYFIYHLRPYGIGHKVESLVSDKNVSNIS